MHTPVASSTTLVLIRPDHRPPAKHTASGQHASPEWPFSTPVVAGEALSGWATGDMRGNAISTLRAERGNGHNNLSEPLSRAPIMQYRGASITRKNFP